MVALRSKQLKTSRKQQSFALGSIDVHYTGKVPMLLSSMFPLTYLLLNDRHGVLVIDDLLMIPHGTSTW